MESRRIVLDLPLGLFSALRKTPEEFSSELRLAAAVKWYEMGMLSQEKAAEAAGLCREDFLMALARFKVSPFQYSHEEILAEAGYDQ
jgi:predicted HTH domain antitoxin